MRNNIFWLCEYTAVDTKANTIFEAVKSTWDFPRNYMMNLQHKLSVIRISCFLYTSIAISHSSFARSIKCLLINPCALRTLIYYLLHWVIFSSSFPWCHSLFCFSASLHFSSQYFKQMNGSVSFLSDSWAFLLFPIHFNSFILFWFT